MVTQKQNCFLYILNALQVFKCPFPCQYVQTSWRRNNTQHTERSWPVSDAYDLKYLTTVAFVLLILKKIVSVILQTN